MDFEKRRLLESESRTLFDTVLFPAYRSHLKSPATRRSCLRLINEFETLCGKPFLLLNSDDGLMYATLLCARVKQSTAFMRLGHIKSIANFCEKNAEMYLSNTSFSGYKSPFAHIRQNLNSSDYIDSFSIPTPKQLNDFLEKCNGETRLVVSLIIKCGLLPKHVRALSLKQIIRLNDERYYIRLIDKGNERYVLIPDDMCEILFDYCTKHSPSFEGTVLKNKKGHCLSERTLEYRYKNEALKYGFSFTMQDLRNAAAAYMLSGGASRESVANLLGISQKWNARFDLAQDRIASFDANDYSLISIKPYNFDKH